jgi:Flp pilus assembly protein TadB
VSALTGQLLALALAAAGCVLLAGAGVRLLAVPAFDVPSVAEEAPAGGPGSVLDRLLARIGRPVVPILDRLGVLRMAARRRQDEIERTMPDVLDVLSVTILSGASFRLGLARVAEAFTGALSEELRTTSRQIEVGVARRQAFVELRDRNTSPALRRFVAMMLQAEEPGMSLAPALTDLAIDMRKHVLQQARRRADSADKSVALISTLVLLPAMLILVLAVFLGSISFGGR